MRGCSRRTPQAWHGASEQSVSTGVSLDGAVLEVRAGSTKPTISHLVHASNLLCTLLKNAGRGCLSCYVSKTLETMKRSSEHEHLICLKYIIQNSEANNVPESKLGFPNLQFCKYTLKCCFGMLSGLHIHHNCYDQHTVDLTDMEGTHLVNSDQSKRLDIKLELWKPTSYQS